MRPVRITPASCVRGKVVLLGDKSIAHRAVLLSAIAVGATRIENFPSNDDCLSTVAAFKRLGIHTSYTRNKGSSSTGFITVWGVGLYGLKKPESPIFVGESGTTLRILLGVLAGQNFTVVLKAGKLLSQRPMMRVTVPLRMMGAYIKARRICCRGKKTEEYAPLTVTGGDLRAIEYTMPVASAQVKSAIALAGLYAQGTTRVVERLKTRDHTERMLKLFKADIKVTHGVILIKGGHSLTSPKKIYIPGDISSAGFFIVLAAICKDSKILLKNVGLNPSRTGILKVLRRMGVCIRVVAGGVRAAAEPMGDLLVKSSRLKGTIVTKEEVPSLIDELPVLMVAACFARGRTIFEGVEELRVKETDRIRSMVENLQKMGACIRVTGNGLRAAAAEKIVIEGGKGLRGAKVKSFGDHRTAMSMIVAALNAQGVSEIDEVNCIKKSFPNFLPILKSLIRIS
jgi:3-phosphoshikimate 1-carboxyvinyltransferase